MKNCSACKKSKDFADFCREKGNSDGLSNYCRECKREKHALWRAANSERNKANVATWGVNNSARRAQAARDWRATNPDQANALTKKWRQENLHACAAYAAQKRALILKATPAWASRLLIQEFYKIAALKTKLTGVAWQVDHIVPLQGKTVCGLHWEGNLQVILATENAKKSNRIWPDMPAGEHYSSHV